MQRPDAGRGHMEVDEEGERAGDRPLILRSFGKCPKTYKTGEDFRGYITRFQLYADLNNIPEQQRGPLLITLLDNHSFDTVTAMQLPNFNNFDRLRDLLIAKFDLAAGQLGNQLRLNARKQLPNESISDYLDSLSQLATRTNLDVEVQHTKIIETIMTNARDPKIRNKVLKFVSQIQDDHLDDRERWQTFVALIEQLNKMQALQSYTSSTDLTKESDIVCELSRKIDTLMALQHKQEPEKAKLKILPPAPSPPSQYVDNWANSRSNADAGDMSRKVEVKNSNSNLGNNTQSYNNNRPENGGYSYNFNVQRSFPPNSAQVGNQGFNANYSYNNRRNNFTPYFRRNYNQYPRFQGYRRNWNSNFPGRQNSSFSSMYGRWPHQYAYPKANTSYNS
jgi:hypothetical protein